MENNSLNEEVKKMASDYEKLLEIMEVLLTTNKDLIDYVENIERD